MRLTARQTDGHSLGHNDKEVTIIKTVGYKMLGNLPSTFYMLFFILLEY